MVEIDSEVSGGCISRCRTSNIPLTVRLLREGRMPAIRSILLDSIISSDYTESLFECLGNYERDLVRSPQLFSNIEQKTK